MVKSNNKTQKEETKTKHSVLPTSFITFLAFACTLVQFFNVFLNLEKTIFCYKPNCNTH